MNLNQLKLGARLALGFSVILVLVIMFEPAGIHGRWVKLKRWFIAFPLHKRAAFRRQRAVIQGVLQGGGDRIVLRHPDYPSRQVVTCAANWPACRLATTCSVVRLRRWP